VKLIIRTTLAVSLALLVSACSSADQTGAHRDEQGHAHDDAKGHSAEDKHSEKEGHSEGDRHENGSSGEKEESHGDVVVLSPEARRAADLTIVDAGPAVLKESLSLYGTIKPNAERMRSVTARFPGVVRSVSVKVGDSVAAGQSLASVESNESLQTYGVSSPLKGVVTERMTNPGEQAEQAALFTIADLSTVWVEVSLFPRDRARVRVGQDARVSTSDGGPSGQGKIVFVSPLGSGPTQSVTARVLLDNPEGQWPPGLYVQADVAIASEPVELAVPAAALQELEETGTSVFVEEGERFEARSVKVGRNDGDHAEILEGIKVGEKVVGEGSFVLKAELGKGAAEHDH